MDKNPTSVKCSICSVVMDRIQIDIEKYDYKCRNKKCSTYEK